MYEVTTFVNLDQTVVQVGNNTTVIMPYSDYQHKSPDASNFHSSSYYAYQPMSSYLKHRII